LRNAGGIPFVKTNVPEVINKQFKF
jgi:Asp-tRNA(Asn)/Glu-tRNA(Gln) amidotransferase A subunit family amidase